MRRELNMMQTRVVHMRTSLADLRSFLAQVRHNGAQQRYLRQRREIGAACRAITAEIATVERALENLEAECAHARDWFS